jgi:hypothetical protein
MKEPFHAWRYPDGRLWAGFYRTGTGYVLRFPGLADFAVSHDGSTISSDPAPGVSPQTIEHLYLNQVLPLALSRQSKLVLHASAVEVDDEAVAFLGLSGRGKSTLAASFATAGYRFLTDDGLHVEALDGAYLVQPSHPSIRLWDDSRAALMPTATAAAPPIDYTPKARLLAGGEVAFCSQARRLRRVYFLGDGQTETVVFDPVTGRDAMIELVRHSFILDCDEPDMLTRHFGQLSAMAALPLFFRLDYPRHYPALPAVRDAVARHATALLT